MYVFLFSIVLLLLYVLWLAQKSRSGIDALSKALSEHLQVKKKVPKGQSVLGYEWHEDGWPFVLEEDCEEREFPFENPTPYYLADAYAQGLLTAEYKGATTAWEKKSLLKRILRTGVCVPLALAEEAFNDENAAVRVYAVSHIGLVYKDYSGDWNNPKILRDFSSAALEDPDPMVRAALHSNPDYHSGRPWSGISQLERLAAMRNPNLDVQFVVAIMEDNAEASNMTTQEHMDLISAAITNPRILEGSRKTGRDYWKGISGDYERPFEEYGRIWRLATDGWLKETGFASQAIPYQVFKYVQTTPAVKLEVYKRLSGEKYAYLRRSILESCVPMRDNEVLKLGWGDPDGDCRESARKRTGPYTKWVGVKSGKSHHAAEGGKEVAVT